MTFKRPRKPSKDLNHNIVKDVCQSLGYQYGGLPLYLVDVADMGGEMLDWLLWLGGLCIAIEVKTPTAYKLKNHRMKPGEIAFMMNCPGVRVIVVTEQDVTGIIETWYPVARLIPVTPSPEVFDFMEG